MCFDGRNNIWPLVQICLHLISDLEIMQKIIIMVVSEFSALLYTLPFENIWIGSIFKRGLSMRDHAEV